jgi:hypothetical protein
MDKSFLLIAFFGIQNQIKLYHWHTTKYSRHISTDKFLEEIAKHIDQFVEVYQGKYGRIMLTNTRSFMIENLSDADAPNYLESFRNFLINDIPKFLLPEDTDLINIRDEMLSLTNQTLYLFTLQ